VARNRKRARERRPRRPSQAANSQQGLPTATESSSLHERELEENGVPELEDDGPPDPLEHATPDVELADAQLAYGRPEEPEPDDEADEEEFELEVEESIDEVPAHPGGRGRRGAGLDGEDAGSGRGGGELAARGPTAPERVGTIARLIGFLQGSWRELQRVQWPDRRQVMQATGVVIGFVIVAAAFLGGADWAAGKIVTFILK
jgi:preprotein translocase subunit SecE